MAHSHETNIPWVHRCIVDRVNPQSVLDVGAGAGKYGKLLKSIDRRIAVTAVEAWSPYVTEFNLQRIYDEVLVTDVRQLDEFSYDLVIFGDVLEHMSEEDALKLWEKVSQQAKYAIIAIPIIHYPQGATDGNPFQEHVDEDWSHERVLSSFSGIVDSNLTEVVGTYLAVFDKE